VTDAAHHGRHPLDHDDKSRVGSTNFQQAASFNPATDFKLLNDASLTTHQNTWRLGADYDLAPSTLLYGLGGHRLQGWRL
jgi:hypothetical protein